MFSKEVKYLLLTIATDLYSLVNCCLQLDMNANMSFAVVWFVQS